MKGERDWRRIWVGVALLVAAMAVFYLRGPEESGGWVRFLMTISGWGLLLGGSVVLGDGIHGTRIRSTP